LGGDTLVAHWRGQRIRPHKTFTNCLIVEEDLESNVPTNMIIIDKELLEDAYKKFILGETE